jgi:uncharacterized protein
VGLIGCAGGAPTVAPPTLLATAVFPVLTSTPLAPALPVTYTPAVGATAVLPAGSPVRATPLPVATAVAIPTATPDFSASLTIEQLAQRPYGGGQLTLQQTLAEFPGFTRHLITYPSDGLTIYGFMNTPPADGLLPVVLVLHGYVDPAEYQIEAYTTPYADALAKAGYLVIHPNFRNYPPSDSGENLFRVGYAIDVLNLIAIIKAQAGQPGPLAQADPNAIYLFGHSMGGGIALRVLTVSDDVRAAALYGAMSGDERRNFERIRLWSQGREGDAELATGDEALQQISPGYFLERIQTPISLHHGLEDGIVPVNWSDELCESLRRLGKVVECVRYPGQPHNFDAAGQQRLLWNVRDFYGRW